MAHIAGGAEVTLGVHGWEDQVGGHCLPACQQPQHQEAGALQQQPPQLGPAVGEAQGLWLCLQRDLVTSRDSHSSTSPGTATPRAWDTPGETGQLCCPLPGCDPALKLTSPSCRVLVTVIPCSWLTIWTVFTVGCGLSCGGVAGTGWRVGPWHPLLWGGTLQHPSQSGYHSRCIAGNSPPQLPPRGGLGGQAGGYYCGY